MSSPNVSTKGAPPLPARRDFTYAPPSDALKILYKDDDIIVVDKPAGLLSVPGRELPDCLQSRLLALYPDSLLVHRLDMATSGVMVFARNKTAQRHLGLQFERRHTSKTYIARVDGNIAGETGRINLPLIADWPNRPRQMVSWERGKPSITDWEVIAREEAATRLALHPVTGRSHQLRVMETRPPPSARRRANNIRKCVSVLKHPLTTASCVLFSWLIKNKISRARFALSVKNHLRGVRNGNGFGMRLNIAVSAVGARPKEQRNDL